eukprot:g41956.t1
MRPLLCTVAAETKVATVWHCLITTDALTTTSPRRTDATNAAGTPNLPPQQQPMSWCWDCLNNAESARNPNSPLPQVHATDAIALTEPFTK